MTKFKRCIRRHYATRAKRQRAKRKRAKRDKASSLPATPTRRLEFPKRRVGALDSRIDVLLEELGIKDENKEEREQIRKILDEVNEFIDNCNAKYPGFGSLAFGNRLNHVYWISYLMAHKEKLSLGIRHYTDINKTLSRMNDSYEIPLDKVDYISLYVSENHAELVIASEDDKAIYTWMRDIGLDKMELEDTTTRFVANAIMRLILYNEARFRHRCKGIKKIRNILVNSCRSSLVDDLRDVIRILHADPKMRGLALQINRELSGYLQEHPESDYRELETEKREKKEDNTHNPWDKWHPTNPHSPSRWNEGE